MVVGDGGAVELGVPVDVGGAGVSRDGIGSGAVGIW